MSQDVQVGCFSRLRQKFKNDGKCQKDGLQTSTENKPRNSLKESPNRPITLGKGKGAHQATTSKPKNPTPVGDGTRPVLSAMPAITDDIEPGSNQDEPRGVTLARSNISTPFNENGNQGTLDVPSSTMKSASIHKALWDKAYSDLKSDPKKAKYMTKYEELLCTVFLHRGGTSHGLGEEQMKEIIALGLKKVEGYKTAVDASESKLKVVTAVRNILDIPLKNIPQAALPWAIILQAWIYCSNQSKPVQNCTMAAWNALTRDFPP